MMPTLLSPVLRVPHGFAVQGHGGPDLPCWRPHQVHGVRIVQASEAGAPAVDADGSLSTDPRLAVAVVTADCIPVLVATDDGTAVAAIHAGWRGLAAGILEAGLTAVRASAPGSPVSVALGPAAGGCCYEVGPEVLEALAPDPAHVTPTSDGHARIDLRAIATDRLVAAGVARDRIDQVGPCTICSGGRWPSYRRDGRAAGRLLAYIAPRP